MSHRYDFRQIEKKWQQTWEENRTFRSLGPGDPGFDAAKPKFYVLDMFPYPSGAGLHVGHPLGYIATDIVARYKRMRGFNVLHPMGFDAFGLPAEQYAIEHGIHPRVTTERNITNMRRQLRALGLSYDWEREIATIEPNYYRWTQWIFIQLFESWFDPALGKARPIAELRAKLDAGKITLEQLSADSGQDASREDLPQWCDLDDLERERWISTQRLAHLADVAVNWCPALGTVLANEEVTNDGRSERGNHPVYKRPLKQWMMRITAYAERLLADLELVQWPEAIKAMQRHWIGRSEGAELSFPIVGHDDAIPVFTTRPDTLFGATYMVLAPEHPLVGRVTTDEHRSEVLAYVERASAKSDLDRQADVKTKTGVFTGAYAVNPVTEREIPIWIADYVMMGYGTGAIMAVPAHDPRDFDFARHFDLPVPAVVMPPESWLLEHANDSSSATSSCDVDALRTAYLEDPRTFDEAFVESGVAVHSKNSKISIDGLSTPDAKKRMIEWLEATKIGRAKVHFKLREWLFSRQRYWGEPFPILHGADGTVRAVDEGDLPVTLPPMDDFKPRGNEDPDTAPQPALYRAAEEWKTLRIDGKEYRRELNTMPQWAGSCWYYLRFIDPHNDTALVDPEKERYWMANGGVDLYVGGAEHAVLHLLYARFWHKVLYDLGHVSTPEPFARLFNQGYIQAYAYQDERGLYVDAAQVEERDGHFFFEGKAVKRSYGKMGKSLKNAVTPDAMCEEFGCDTLRLYEMFMGPLDVSKPWNTRDSIGVHRFLQRVWRNFIDQDSGEILIDERPPDEDMLKAMHKTLAEVTADMESMSYNTALARLIELNNRLVGIERIPRLVAETFLLMLAPQAPHIAEELWQRIGHEHSLHDHPWPQYDEAMLQEDRIEIAVQVMGKMRGRVQVPADASQSEIEKAAAAESSVARHLEGKTIRKVIFVPGRLINFIAA